MTELLLLLVLILFNGLFAMSETAVVSSRRARLMRMAETNGGARPALALAPSLHAFSPASRSASRPSAF